jgi:HlyD family secretion protein
VNQARKFAVLLGVIAILATGYYFLSTDHTSDLQLIGLVDANQVVVSAKIAGRIEKLTVDEGSQVRQGDLIAQLDTAELLAAQQSAAAVVASMNSQVAGTQASELLTKGTTSSDVVSAQAKQRAAQADLAQAQADLVRIRLDARRSDALARQGVASQQEKDTADANLKAQEARVRSLQDQVRASEADLNSAKARTHQTRVAESTVASTRAQQLQAEAERAQAEARLSYTRVLAPISGTVSIRVAREGEVVGVGEPIVTIIDLNDTWVRAPLPESYADTIGLGDTLKIRLPGGDMTEGKVIFKAVEADYATQRDVSRRKRDIKTIVLKLAVENAKRSLVPGMTAIVLVPQSKLRGK